MPFFKASLLTGFQGALPQSEIRRLSIGDQGRWRRSPRAAELSEAGGKRLIDMGWPEGAAQDALDTFTAILGRSPNTLVAYGGMVRAYIALGGQLDHGRSPSEWRPRWNISKARRA